MLLTAVRIVSSALKEGIIIEINGVFIAFKIVSISCKIYFLEENASS
jgi:hypothetical protein